MKQFIEVFVNQNQQKGNTSLERIRRSKALLQRTAFFRFQMKEENIVRKRGREREGERERERGGGKSVCVRERERERFL
jgi:hypothetical protein